MTAPDNFCAMILSHGRARKVYTYDTLIRRGYTGPIFIVIDDEDESRDEYFEEFGKENVLIFSKSEIAKTFDEGDNFNDRRAIIYARNASFDLARQAGFRYFIQLDDDYTDFNYRFDKEFRYQFARIKSLDAIFSSLLEFFKATPFASVAMAQGGDFIGGQNNSLLKAIQGKRKAMNSFICDTERPFKFVGRINEDVNTYTCEQRRGVLFLSTMQVALQQKQTQSNSGGMTELYLDAGTYVKSFYSIMYAPSCVTISDMGDAHRRIHHNVHWDNAAPQIVREVFRKKRRLEKAA